MNQLHIQVGVVTISLINALFYAQPIAAQVVPDDTLPAGERSQVGGNSNVQIDGGARRGGNLFHSFDQFSIPTGGSASFNNVVDVQNIFSRVTGGSASNIDGLIRANGTANLFLLNPNGILFGPNARLNIGGSFIATTANSINFADNFQYSATNSQTTPLLTMSVPVGLQMGTNPGRIVVQGNGYDLSVSVPIFSPLIRGNNTAGLRVPTGQTLALIGGNIAINGGTLTAEQGRIELGSVRDGQVSLSSTRSSFAFDYQESQGFGNIRLSQQALGDASGGGVIQVRGNQVSLTDGSLLLIQNQGTQAGGSINVNAVQSLEVSGTSPDGSFLGGLEGEAVGVGRGADVTVSTRQLSVLGGAGIVSRSYSSADTGNVTVNALGSVQVGGFSPANPTFFSVIATTVFGSGSGGTVTVLTKRLNLLDGGVVAAPTLGTGQGGTVTVSATEAVEIIGRTPLFSPSSVNSSTTNAGNSGAITINTARLVLRDGGTVSSASLATGNAGSITINASESVEVTGTGLADSTPSYVGSSAPIAPETVRQTYELPDRPSGNSGSLTINTPRLSITDRAIVTVSNDGIGNAGTLRVNANSISLDSRGAITAATASGEGGNIDLNVQNVLLLRNNGQITTSAGGNGGNIQINASSLVAVPNENSDIRANSVNARGGNITINTSGIFGIQFRPQNTPLSDITATGATSTQSGTVQLNIEQLDPTYGLIELPTTVSDPSRLIAQGCPADEGNSFVIIGRGGLPPTPAQELDDAAEWSDRSILTIPQHSIPHSPAQNSRLPHTPYPTPYTPIPEANGWQTAPDGEVLLVAHNPNPAGQPLSNYLTTCREEQ